MAAFLRITGTQKRSQTRRPGLSSPKLVVHTTRHGSPHKGLPDIRQAARRFLLIVVAGAISLRNRGNGRRLRLLALAKDLPSLVEQFIAPHRRSAGQKVNWSLKGGTIMHIALGIAIAGLLSLSMALGGDSKSDLEKLQGKWAAEADGKKLEMTFSKNSFALTISGDNKELIVKGVIKI